MNSSIITSRPCEAYQPHAEAMSSCNRRSCTIHKNFVIDIGLSNVSRFSIDFLKVTTRSTPVFPTFMFRRPLHINGMCVILILHVIGNLKPCNLQNLCVNKSILSYVCSIFNRT